jgi:molybdenum cofactor biosynthesis protein B
MTIMDSAHTRRLRIQAAVITVSTTRSEETDISGKIIHELLTESGIEVSYYEIVPDRIGNIQEALHRALRQSNCIIFCGGTGLTTDDCTIEAVQPLLQKQINGFGELFRWMSYQDIGTSAILSRAIAGIIDKNAIFCIPGSPSAARLAISGLIIPEISHILSHAQR